MQTALSLPTCTFSFGLFFCLLWLGIHNGSIFFIQIQLNVKSVQPFCFFFQLIFNSSQISESIWYTEGGYTVKSGDTLFKIAKRNHMTLAQLLRRNVQITNQNVIRVGQKLNLE